LKKPLIILTGPTAVGKTKLSIELAKAVNSEIISADSMQVYRSMDIGSAKITADEMQGVRHYLIDVIEPDEEFNVVKFKELALAAMEQIYSKGKIPMIVGGTGFYIQALLNDIDFTKEKVESDYRKKLEQIAETEGSEPLYQMLQEADADSAETIHKNNVKRVIRALEYFHLTGEKFSAHNKKQREKLSPYNFAYFVLNDDRELLYQKIDQRIDKMIREGLLQEVSNLKKKGYTKDMVSMQGLGYKEILAYLDGLYSFEEAVYILKRDTRHFAKRQLTWFKREKEVIWIQKDKFERNEDLILDEMKHILIEKRIWTA
jgi:tRNA dimethylallyltransferase